MVSYKLIYEPIESSYSKIKHNPYKVKCPNCGNSPDTLLEHLYGEEPDEGIIYKYKRFLFWYYNEYKCTKCKNIWKSKRIGV